MFCVDQELKGLEMRRSQTLAGHGESSDVTSITGAGRLNTMRPPRPDFSSNQCHVVTTHNVVY